MEIIFIVSSSSSRIKSNGVQPLHLTLEMLALHGKKNYKRIPWNNALCSGSCNHSNTTEANNFSNAGLVVQITVLLPLSI